MARGDGGKTAFETDDEGRIDDDAMAAIRRGWDLGKENFKNRLLKRLDKATGRNSGTRNRTGEALREHGEADAERIMRRAVRILGLTAGRGGAWIAFHGSGKVVADFSPCVSLPPPD